MPKYFSFKVADCYLYYTKHCIIEAMHVHASDRKMTESGSAKFFVYQNGDTEIQEIGVLTDIQINKIRKFIKKHYLEMFEKWSQDSEMGFYGNK